MSEDLQIVTGALGYSGQYITRRLLQRGVQVRTLTSSPNRRNPFGREVEVQPFHFDAPEKLVESLRGADVLYNTYWVRFNHHTFTFAQAVKNTLTLFDCARRARVRRVVHVSITHPDENANLEYFRGKAVLEKALIGSGLSHAILRPAVLFGKEDILVNNIAWVLRRLPVFGVFGDGLYKLQPIYVDDLAAIAVAEGQRQDNAIVEAIGPETFTYRGLVEEIGRIIGKRRRIVSVSPGLGYGVGWMVGKMVRDVIITRDEIRGLMQGRLFVDVPPPALAVTKLTEWAGANREWLGSRYASELGRRRDRVRGYVRERGR